MLDTVFGLPVHPLIVHATTVIVPAAAVAVLLAALWPRFRRWARWLPLGLATAAVVLTPLSTESGESLERRVEHSQLIEQHSELADGLLPWVIGLFVAALLLALVMRRERAVAAQGVPAPRDASAARGTGATRASRALLVGAAVLGIVAAAGTTVQVVRIGHSGAQAAWSDAVSQTPAPPASGDGDSDGS
jgi:Ca2+/Na+ antiporter